MALSRSSVLFYWDALHGIQPLAGGDPTFARGGGATFRDRQGFVRSLAARIPRQEWMELDGVIRPVLLLEPGRTNGWTHSEDLASSTWTRSGVDVTPDVHGTLDRVALAAGLSNTSGHVRRSWPAAAQNSPQALSFSAAPEALSWLAVATYGFDGVDRLSWIDLATGEVGTRDAAHTITVERLADRVRVSVVFNSGSGLADPYVGIYPCDGNGSLTVSQAGRGIRLGEMQFEANCGSASRYVATDAAIASRPAEQLHFAGAPRPQAMATYVRAIAGSDASATEVQLHLGETDSPQRFLVYYSGGRARTYFNNGAGHSTADVPLAMAPGDTFEMLAILHADTSTRIVASVNGSAAAGAAGGATAGGGMPGGWNGDGRMWLNSQGASFIGAHRYAEVKVVKLGDFNSTTDQAYMDEIRSLVLGPAGDVL